MNYTASSITAIVITLLICGPLILISIKSKQPKAATGLSVLASIFIIIALSSQYEYSKKASKNKILGVKTIVITEIEYSGKGKSAYGVKGDDNKIYTTDDRKRLQYLRPGMKIEVEEHTTLYGIIK